MKVAITADLHLRTFEEYPERYNALDKILAHLTSHNIEILIVAGDLFDADLIDYSDLEQLCARYPNIQFHIIPGNHDVAISEAKIVGSNIHIYTDTKILEIDSTDFLLIPYDSNATMGDKLAATPINLNPNRWILVSHGDYMECNQPPSSTEPGVYMPLSRSDLERYPPKNVILGHIHRPHTIDNVHYVGSPQGLDITETGRRTFLVFDTDTGLITPNPVTNDVLYFNESFVIVPLENDAEILKQEIKARIHSWELQRSEHDKVEVRVTATGFTTDRSNILKTLKRGFRKYRYYDDDSPRIDQLYISADYQRDAVAKRVQDLIDTMQWSFDGDEPAKEDVLIAALRIVYGR